MEYNEKSFLNFLNQHGTISHRSVFAPLNRMDVQNKNIVVS